MKISGLSFSCFPQQRFISAWNKHALLNQCCPQPPVSPRRTSNLIWLCKQRLAGQKKWCVPTTEESNWEGTGCRRWCLLVEWQANISTKHMVGSYTATAVRILERGALKFVSLVAFSLECHSWCLLSWVRWAAVCSLPGHTETNYNAKRKEGPPNE